MKSPNALALQQALKVSGHWDAYAESCEHHLSPPYTLLPQLSTQDLAQLLLLCCFWAAVCDEACLMRYLRARNMDVM